MIKKKICSLALVFAQLFSAAYAFAEDISAQGDNAAEDSAREESYVQPADEIQIFVSPDGSDSNSGSYSAPLKSISAGISLGASTLASSGDKKVSVNIRGGDYRINNTIKITASGRANNPLVIQGYKDERSTLK